MCVCIYIYIYIYAHIDTYAHPARHLGPHGQLAAWPAHRETSGLRRWRAHINIRI